MFFFLFPSSSDTRSAVFLWTRAAQPGRGGCVDSLSLLLEKVHNVSPVHRLTLEASQQRTKLSQSRCSTWASDLSSGSIKLLRKGMHRGHLSCKAVGAWTTARQPLQLRKSALFAACTGMCRDRGAGLGGRSGAKGTDRVTGKKLHSVVRTLRLSDADTQLLRICCLHASLSRSSTKYLQMKNVISVSWATPKQLQLTKVGWVR